MSGKLLKKNWCFQGLSPLPFPCYPRPEHHHPQTSNAVTFLLHPPRVTTAPKEWEHKSSQWPGKPLEFQSHVHSPLLLVVCLTHWTCGLSPPCDFHEVRGLSLLPAASLRMVCNSEQKLKNCWTNEPMNPLQELQASPKSHTLLQLPGLSWVPGSQANYLNVPWPWNSVRSKQNSTSSEFPPTWRSFWRHPT